MVTTNRRDFIGGAIAAGLLPGCVSSDAPSQKPLKFLLMSDTHVESDFLEHGRPVYTCWKPGDYAALRATYAFINDDPFCRDARFALFCGDQINTGYSAQQRTLDDEMRIYSETLGTLDLHRTATPADLASFDFRTQPYVCRENLVRGQKPFDVVPPPLSSRVIAIQGNHDTGCPTFYRDCSFRCGDVRFISFFASYVGLPAPAGSYRSTARIADETIAFVEREMSAAAADPTIRHIVLCSHWSIVTDKPDLFKCPIVDACKENGYSDNRRKLLALAEKYGCDLYINGHEHNPDWPFARVGNLADVNCGTLADAHGTFAIVEIYPDRAVFTVYSSAAAAERDGVCQIVRRPSRLFIREIPLTP